jgi:hypothetical protein
MKIKFGTLFTLIMVGLFIFVASKARPLISNIVDDIDQVYTYGPGRMLIKFMFFGLICITIVVVAKLLSKK